MIHFHMVDFRSFFVLTISNLPVDSLLSSKFKAGMTD